MMAARNGCRTVDTGAQRLLRVPSGEEVWLSCRVVSCTGMFVVGQLEVDRAGSEGSKQKAKQATSHLRSRASHGSTDHAPATVSRVEVP